MILLGCFCQNSNLGPTNLALNWANQGVVHEWKHEWWAVTCKQTDKQIDCPFLGSDTYSYCSIFIFSPELTQGLDTDKINPYIEKCIGVKKPLITVSKGPVGLLSSFPSVVFCLQLILFTFARFFVCCALNVWRTMVSNPRCWSSTAAKYYRWEWSFVKCSTTSKPAAWSEKRNTQTRVIIGHV